MSQHLTNPGPGGPQPTSGHGGPPPGHGAYQVRPVDGVSGENPAGRAALAFAAVIVAAQVLGQVLFHSLLGSSRLSVAGAISGWFGMGSTVFALAAMVLGAIGLRKPGAAKGAAGIGFGVGAYVALMGAVNLVAGLVHYL